jgi:hypothetical protein
MSSLKSFFRKKHRYETQADLKDMSAEQIVNLNPKDVGTYLENETGGIPLEGQKRRAMFTLLNIKKREKETPNATAKQRAITSFLEREGIKSNPEVDAVIAEATLEVAKEDIEKIKEQIEIKDMTNRLYALDNKPPIPDTEEEAMVRRLMKLGGRRKRTVSKRKRRAKTRKGRKGRKTNRRR